MTGLLFEHYRGNNLHTEDANGINPITMIVASASNPVEQPVFMGNAAPCDSRWNFAHAASGPARSAGRLGELEGCSRGV